MEGSNDLIGLSPTAIDRKERVRALFGFAFDRFDLEVAEEEAEGEEEGEDA